MDVKDLISVMQLCEHYNVEISFFDQLDEVGLINVTNIKQKLFQVRLLIIVVFIFQGIVIVQQPARAVNKINGTHFFGDFSS